MLSAKDRQRRRNHLGASDSAALLGLSPWATPTSLFWEKRADLLGDLDPEVGETSTAAIEAGNVLERSVLDWAEADLGCSLLRQAFVVSTQQPIFSTTFDALVPGRPFAVEAKTTGIVAYNRASTMDEWGREDSDEIPAHYLVQCQHGLYVGELETMWVYALIGGRGFVRYRVDRNDTLIGAILTRGREFWEQHVVPGVPPSEEPPPMDLLKSLKRKRGEPIQLPEQATHLARALEAVKEAKREFDADIARAEAAMVALLQDREHGILPDGRRFTFYESQREGIDLKRLKAEMPRVYQKYLITNIYRNARITKGTK